MGTITSKDGTEIYFKDWGTGPVVTFSHGWPLNSTPGTDKCSSWHRTATAWSPTTGVAMAVRANPRRATI